MAKITQAELNRRLNKNGWTWHLISTATPGIVRIQLGSDGDEEDGIRKCIEASTIDQAVIDAEKFVSSIAFNKYAKSY